MVQPGDPARQPRLIRASYTIFAATILAALMAGPLSGPASAQGEIVQKLNREIARALLKPDVQQRLLTVGMETPPDYAPAEVAEFVRADVARWTQLVEAVGLEKLRDGAQ